MSATLPLLASQLIRRPLLPGSIGGSSCQLCSRRWASGGRKQKLKRGGTAVGAGTRKNSVPPNKKPAPTIKSRSIPPPRKDLPKAPHMQAKNIPKDNKDTLMGFFQNNPLFVAIAVVPTGVMGVLLLFRPQLRPAWMGGQSQVGGGSGETGGVKGGDGGRSSLINKNIANAPALYESADESLKQVEEILTDKEEGEDVGDESTKQPSKSVEEEVAIVHEISVNDNENAIVVVDLIHAIGIRPHPSS